MVNQKPVAYKIIRDLMKKNDMNSVYELSIASGVPEKTVRRYMNGYSKNLKEDTKDKIAEALGVDSSYIFDHENEVNKNYTSREAYHTIRNIMISKKNDLNNKHKLMLIEELLEED